MQRIALGFLLAVAAARFIALFTAIVPFLRTLFSPALSVIKATPVASFIVLALVWMKSGTIPSFTSFLMVLPVVWSNAHAGLLSADRDLLEMTRAYGLSRAERMKSSICLGAALFHRCLRYGRGLAWKAGIAAEVLSRTAFSIGRRYTIPNLPGNRGPFAWTAC
jgi:NitT/TauT family transport system permease protein